MTDKPKRNVIRDTACPSCGKLFYKHAVRVHAPFCKGKAANTTGGGAAGAPSLTTAPAATSPTNKAPAPGPARASWVF